MAQDGIGRHWMALDSIKQHCRTLKIIGGHWMALIGTVDHYDSKWQVTASKCSRWIWQHHNALDGTWQHQNALDGTWQHQNALHGT
jgi:hypothetical protein